MDPFQDRHDARHSIASAAEFTLRKPHELVRWTKPARQEKRQHIARKVGPYMLTTCLRQQLAKLFQPPLHNGS